MAKKDAEWKGRGGACIGSRRGGKKWWMLDEVSMANRTERVLKRN